jgi:fructose-bisphosphate aldolase, class I
MHDTAQKLVADFKGILAADESTGTIAKRFQTINLESTPENRNTYRELLFTTPEIEQYISGVILFEESLPLAKILTDRGIIAGVKVDIGKVDLPNFPGESITEGLDALPKRLEEYKKFGVKFTKWRAVIAVGEGIPSLTCIHSNAENLARFAAISQAAGLVPIVEPEVLMDGSHSLDRCREVTSSVLQNVFSYLKDHKVDLTSMLLKPNMILPGKDFIPKATSEEIAKATLDIFKVVIPASVPGVVFLSGGQTPEEASENLNMLNKLKADAPWGLSYSFGRALQEPVLKTWLGKPENKTAAQLTFAKRAQLNFQARKGEYHE